MTIVNSEIYRLRISEDGAGKKVKWRKRSLIVNTLGLLVLLLEGVPADWVNVEAWLPPAVAGDVLALAQSLRSAQSQEERSGLAV
ncbi:hypothetical protein ALQ53_200206 [Pseudomonas cannabina]|uniref:Uncharacterized protein n=2 Tax=Pseudomonas syringae group TaxID=136849 RepID=A0AB37QCV9_PSECA|nr:hypothetical protein [Pseudomonas cannabina]RMN83378.1 hypothetical protein ALQ53_200206 [Pseudomonas cannabina]